MPANSLTNLLCKSTAAWQML